MGIFNRKSRSDSGWRLKSADLAERIEDVCNPCRGWYQIHTFLAEAEPDFGELEWCLDRKDTLALVFLDIGAFRDRNLDRTAFERMGRILDFFRKNGYDMILRVAYDHQGKAVEREPYFWDQVKAHMRQVGELLEDKGEGVFVYQGLLTGNWGEMHTTRFQDEKKRKELWQILREYLPEDTYAAVRRPAYWRQLNEEGADKTCAGPVMGLFDDAMFASGDHLGTFGTLNRENGWGEAWNREAELAFEEELCSRVPNGGEAVFGEEMSERLTPALVEDTLRKMHVTYLNKVYDSGILDLWKQWKYEGAEGWNGKSLYDYIGAHLGYRLVIRSVRLHPLRAGDGGSIEIAVENTGFASLYQEAEFWLEGRNGLRWLLKQEGKHREPVWKSRETRILLCNIPLAPMELWILGTRKTDGRRIRFANGCDGDGKTKIGELINVH